ncbi:CaiB/BaiF CoA transferase family protein [Aureimonas jatrophae]|uniref:Crotonobetainyl-CoA:carnitine CoA-transferase CaiB n=1 Tax=Aureimonas jatrophae TaxID=1166073 RepID=A0A1H0EGT8_9HYPH|nr:CoA transferase [Aureimonas jatrophae]MBB3952842.1 crotonobetainyl-CoA:carnitine CoA-transferase CaiB-like acyl-CoA transferase [Aureimonas jatrophae]SDN81541.1 Crotonobetainyl-CoA:carnitine CoA-transferase CaiB [Aureimonas jatrophae]
MSSKTAGAPGRDTSALKGIQVVELGMVMQVPLAGQMLGDLGADVIKVERLPPGEILRTLDPIGFGTGKMSCYYAALCRNKRTLSLDIKSEKGRAALLRLIDTADVLLHNFRPGVMERLGLDYETLRSRNPRLIYAAGSAFGSEGPMASLPGQDMLAQSFSGLARSGRDDDAPPQLVNSPMIDYLTASSLTQGILAALLERGRSGEGQMVSTSLFDNALAVQVLETASLAMHRTRTSWIQYSMMFRTSDGWLCVLTLFRDNPAKGICEAFDQPDISTRAEFATYRLQVENLAALEDHLSPIVKTFSTAECVDRLSQQNVLCAPINTLEDALSHQQATTNEALWEVEIAGYGPVRLAGNPVKLSRTPPTMRFPPADVGENSVEILSSLGFSDLEIDDLTSSGLLHVRPTRQ